VRVALLPVLVSAALLGACGQGTDGDADDLESQEAEFRAIEARLLASGNPYLGDGLRRELEAKLEDQDLPRRRRARTSVRLARVLLKTGEVDRAIGLLEAARPVLERGGDGDEVLPLLALAHLRQAEAENCILRHNAACCIFPLAGAAVHVERAPARAAKALYEEILRGAPGDLESLWLLNVAAMALEEYPDGVAEGQRLPPEAFASDAPFPRLTDVAPALGVDTFNLCGGAAVEDFDGDGWLDVLTSTYDPGGPLTFYRNTGAGGFEDRSEASRASDQLGGLNLIAGDVDGDGDQDVLVLRGAWLGDDGRLRNSLLRNDGGVFVDVTRAAGLAEPARPTQAATFGDFDGDGHLDLFVGNESRVAVEPEADHPGQLFLGDGSGRFTDRARAAGITGTGFTKGVCAGDYDNDGDLDLYLSNIGPNQLFRNQGDGTFREVAAQAGVTGPKVRSFACWFFDYDNDGWLDLFVAAYEATVADLAAEALGRPLATEPPRLYRNRGDGTFEDVAREVGLARPFKPMGANFGDLDGDGWLDVYLATGEPQLQSLMPNAMLRNVGGRRFDDVTTAAGLGHLQKGHGVAFCDLDHDGDADVYHQLGGFFFADRFHNALFENPGSGHRWLYLDLVGTRTNRAGVGARIRVVVVDEGGKERELHRAAGAVSSFGGSPHRQEIGLGDAAAVRRLEVRWPDGGTTQVFEDVPLDAWLRVTEGEAGFERLPLTPVRFATGD
jgi:hypothetical protein